MHADPVYRNWYLRTGGRWFDPRLTKQYFRELINDLFLFFHRCPLLRQGLCGKGATGLKRILCGVLIEELPEIMNMCRRSATEIMLITLSNQHAVYESVNQSLCTRLKPLLHRYPF